MSKFLGEVDVDPLVIFFTHSRIRPVFTGCNKRIADTVDEIVQGVIKVSDLPMITVVSGEQNGQTFYYSLNNRRLFTLKLIRQLGLLEKVRVRLKVPSQKEIERYTPERCSLEAVIMKEFVLGDSADNSVGGGGGGGGDKLTIKNSDMSINSVFSKAEAHSTITSSNNKVDKLSTDSIVSSLVKTKISYSSDISTTNQSSTTSSSAAVAASVSSSVQSFVKKLKPEIEKLLKKGKIRDALSKIDEFCDEQSLNDLHRSYICAALGIEKF